MGPGTSAEYRGAPDRHRLVAGLAEPGQRPLRIHARGRRQPRAARLRAGRAGPAARGRARGRRWTRSRSRTSTSTTGATSSRGSGAASTSPRTGLFRSRSSGCSPAATSSSTALGERLGFPDMFQRTFHLSEYEPDVPFEIGKLDRHADACPALHAPDVRVPRPVERRGARVLGRLGAVGRAREVGARRRSLRLRGDAPAR